MTEVRPGARRRGLALLAVMLVAVAAADAQPPPGQARLVVIIDDLGNSEPLGLRTARLPGPVACAILPHTPHARQIAEAAHAHRKPVMLHLPMSSDDGSEPGPGKLEPGMSALELRLTLDYDLQSIPYVSGINNHMGSQLTRQDEPMDTLMAAVRRPPDLFFVDSVTTAHSVIPQAAESHGVPLLRRDVFLDNTRTVEAVETQFDLLLAHARQHGQAIGIGHPYPETLTVLERRLPDLRASDVQLVTPAELLDTYHKEQRSWQLSSSPSPTAAKSWRPSP